MKKNLSLAVIGIVGLFVACTDNQNKVFKGSETQNAVPMNHQTGANIIPDDFSSTVPNTSEKNINKDLETFRNERKIVEKNLINFDDLDFNVYSHQKWDEMGRSHDDGIIVHYPDGTQTVGLKAHIDRSKKIFAFAPDTENPIHHIRIGQGDYTAVTGVWRGTFTKPMKLSNGEILSPTNKKFEIEMATLARWNDQGKMVEEWLFYDDYTFLSQIGAL